MLLVNFAISLLSSQAYIWAQWRNCVHGTSTILPYITTKKKKISHISPFSFLIVKFPFIKKRRSLFPYKRRSLLTDQELDKRQEKQYWNIRLELLLQLSGCMQVGLSNAGFLVGRPPSKALPHAVAHQNLLCCFSLFDPFKC